ncbi:MAG TPA: histidine--tRNA ligase, partial [Pyrinomonadaceae bacterium]|nr:histidine--tRNA ligase [Pyrinomonadaceae bacterium]
EGNQLIFKILKRGEAFAANLNGFAEIVKAGSYGTHEENDPSYATAITREFCDLGLRYDLTVPFARVIANRRNELPKFFKRYQIQPVWRADRPARGRFREFYQCDVDTIGSASPLVESELIKAVSEILEQLGFDDFVIKLNHRELLSEILTAAEVPEQLHSAALVTLDKLDKIGTQEVLRELETKGIKYETGGLAWSIFRAAKDSGDNENLLNEVDQFIEAFLERKSKNVGWLRELIKLTSNLNVRIDTSLARGLSYYTGTIMEINVPDLAGSLGGGGRYDGLIGMFGKEQIPACGFSLGLERILVVMDERGMFPPEIAEARAADVMVTIWNEETIPEPLKLADELRKRGLRVLVYPEADKLGKQIKYADSIGIPFVCVLGESELAENKIALKDLKTGEQQSIDRSEIARHISSRKSSSE